MVAPDTSYYKMYADWDERSIDFGERFKKSVGLDIYVRNVNDTVDSEGERVGRIVGYIFLVELMINKYRYDEYEIYDECDKCEGICVDAASCLLSEDDGLWATEYSDIANRNFIAIHSFYIESKFRGNKIAKVVLDNLKKVLSYYYNVSVSWIFYSGAYIKEWNYSEELDWYYDCDPECTFKGSKFDETKHILNKLGFKYFDFETDYYDCEDIDDFICNSNCCNKLENECDSDYQEDSEYESEDDMDNGIYYRILIDDINGDHYYDCIFSENELSIIDFIFEKYDQVVKDWIYSEMPLTTSLDYLVISNLKEYISNLEKIMK